MIKSTSDVIKSRYNHISNLVQSQTRKGTKDHVSSLSKNYFDAPKPSWRWLNSHKGNLSPVSPLSHGDRNVIENASKAEAFNAYFSSMFNDDDGSDISTLQKSLIFHPSVIQTVKFKERGIRLVVQICYVPSHLLKLDAEFIVPSLTHIISISDFFWEASSGLCKCRHCICLQERQ